MTKFDKIYKEIVEIKIKMEYGVKEMSELNMLMEPLLIIKVI